MKASYYFLCPSWLLALVALLSVVSCSLLGDDAGAEAQDDYTFSHDMIVLGNQLEDPYSMENMTKALSSLYSTKASRVELSPTDIYVRFLPAAQEQLEMLESAGVDFLDHPLDYKIVRDGDYYHDPSISNSDITWQYAVVPPDLELEVFGMEYEVLDNCYIPEHASPATKSSTSWVDWDAVEREAFRLTGNGAMIDELSTKAEGSGTPSGRICIHDDKLDSEPVGVAGVKVNCNTFVKFGNAYTDEEGYYQMTTSFSSSPRYRLIFHNRKGFCLGFNLLLVQASVSTLGKHSASGVNVEIDRKSERKLFLRSVVNNAGFDYYSSCSVNGQKMKAPPSNLRVWLLPSFSRSLPAMLQQGALIDGSMVDEFLGEYLAIAKMFLPDLLLGLSGCESYDAVYSQALHAFAHASHYMMVGNSWWGSYLKNLLSSFASSGGVWYGVGTESGHGYVEVAEMWAYYMQSALYRSRYKDSSAAFGTSYWFSPQVLLYLDERGLARFSLISGFSSDVIDRSALQSRLTALYPEFKSTIVQAFARYD